ncbi:hypothetical protein GOBAR_DD09886 [Gossypium barbadense]|nr:hypothetical protein GOBAR_DD09886 [Gossypium barbadense]
MEDFPAKKLDLDTLKKWGATLKKAEEVGFQVGFADDLLRKKIFHLFYYSTKQNWSQTMAKPNFCKIFYDSARNRLKVAWNFPQQSFFNSSERPLPRSGEK